MAALLVCSGSVFAQEVDDMYFNARDRVTHTEAAEATMAVRYASQDKEAVKSNPVNPSDTYTGRGVNPEYNAQQKNGAEIVQGNPDYFLSSYKAKGINSNQYANTSTLGNNCGCSSYSGFGNPYGNFYSPYGYGYSPYGMGYGMSPYGMGYGSSISMMYGMGSMYGMYGMGYGYGMPYGMYSPYGYRPTVVYGPTYEGIPTTYGRRADRSASGTASAYTGSGSTRPTNGRTRVAGQARTDYYDAKWRNDPNNLTRSYSGGRTTSWSPSSTSSGRNSSWQPASGSRSRSSFDTFGTGGSRSAPSMGGGASSGGGGGRSRGRN